MRDITIKWKWGWLIIIVITVSVGFNIFSITLFQLRIQYLSNPVPDADVTNAFKSASSELVAPKTFSLKWGNKYYLLIETTKEIKDKFEKFEQDKKGRR